MVLRDATDADRPAIVAMGLRFLHHSRYGALIGEGATAGSIENLVASIFHMRDTALAFAHVAVDDDGEVFGMIGGIGAVHPINAQPYADELCWWVEPAHRGGLLAGPALLTAFETWARRFALKFVKVAAPSNAPSVGRYYGVRGYEPVETAYMKELA